MVILDDSDAGRPEYMMEAMGAPSTIPIKAEVRGSSSASRLTNSEVGEEGRTFGSTAEEQGDRRASIHQLLLLPPSPASRQRFLFFRGLLPRRTRGWVLKVWGPEELGHGDDSGDHEQERGEENVEEDVNEEDQQDLVRELQRMFFESATRVSKSSSRCEIRAQGGYVRLGWTTPRTLQSRMHCRRSTR